MTPGRPLDALVAEKVMGLQDFTASLLWKGELLVRRSKDDAYMPLPCYSTDISAAWMVVEKMKEIKPGWAETIDEDRTRLVLSWEIKEKKWEAGWAAADEIYLREWGALGETAPHAICLVALKACGVEVK